MMGKSHPPDKHGCRPTLRGWHASIPRNGVSRFAGRYGTARSGFRRLKQGSNNKRKRMSKDGLCVIVTGSASGLGAATSGILARGGARIVVNYSNSKNEAEATAEACRKAGAKEVIVVQGDVARDEDCKKIAAAAAPWGKLDALINNAGTT